MTRRHRALHPLTNRGRGTIVVIVAVFAAFSVFSLLISTRAVDRSQHRAAVAEVMSRQRTLVERYVNEVLIVRSHGRANPDAIADALLGSASALLNGGNAPAVDGDDDETHVPAVRESTIRAQLVQGRNLIEDLVDTGRSMLAGMSTDRLRQRGHEHITTTDPVLRLRILAAMTENVALNAARTAANQTERNLGDLRRLQWALAAAGALIALSLGWALHRAAHRQTAHFRALVTRSTDLVAVFAKGQCRYVSDRVADGLGHNVDDLLGPGFETIIHPDDRPVFTSTIVHAQTHEIVVRARTTLGDWRHLEAHVSDLRDDNAVRGVVLNARDITERVRLEDELTHHAFHDVLTGLANRALFRDRLELALARSARSHEVLAVVLFDLDGFKHVNDSLGHNAGDALLCQIAQRLTGMTRPSDTVARLGGDEFVLLLEGTSDSGARRVAQQILDELAVPATVLGRPLAVGASIGIALHAGGEGDVEQLMSYADVAMYAAKEAGRGRYELFRYEMARDFGEFLGLEQAMRAGLRTGEFSVHYQPTVDIATGEITGTEALLRWWSASYGQVAPDRFIPVAESSGLIHALGEHVLRTACAQATEWRNWGIVSSSFVMWVNISGKQLTVGGLLALVRDAIEQTGLPPSCLGLEITENAIVDEGSTGDRARSELRELHELGVKIALDDFGTGFSSLGHLRRLPIDVIKVDRSFVEGVERDAKNAAITSNLASLAHALGLIAVAEGVESHAELATVRELGCDSAQGFLFARPAPPEIVTVLLKNQRHFAVTEA